MLLYVAIPAGNAIDKHYLGQREKAAEGFGDQSIGTSSGQSPLGSEAANAG